MKQKISTTQTLCTNTMIHPQHMEPIGALAGGIAHDFNNILGTIMCSSELLLDVWPKKSPHYEDIQRILKVCIRGKKLVQRIFSYTNAPTTEHAPLHLGHLVKDLLPQILQTIPARITVKQRMNAAHCMINGSGDQIQQMIVNLITNAVHALQYTQVPLLEICISNTPATAQNNLSGSNSCPPDVVLSIRDNGQGIAPENKVKIFTPFFTTQKNEGGTGLGLAIVAEIAKHHQATVLWESRQGDQTTFAVHFPGIEKSSPKVSRSQKTTMEPKVRDTEGTILFIEDDKDLLQAMGKNLEKMGYSLLLAHSGISALKLFADHEKHIDMVITDQDIPEITGNELCKKIHSVNPHIPALILTGSTPMCPEKCIPTNIKGIIPKPVTRAALAEYIQTFMVTR